MNESSIWAQKTAEELVYYMANQGDPGSRAHEEVKGALAWRLVKTLCDTIDRHEKAATWLGWQVLVLNIILGLFTIVGTVLAFKK